MTIGQYIVKCRESAKLTQGEIGDTVGLSQSQISRIELGDSSPSIELLQRLAAVKGLNFELSKAVTLPVRKAA